MICDFAQVAQSAEQGFCKPQVGGSIPLLGFGQVPEWPKGTDCKSVALALRRFESSPAHYSSW